MQQVLFFWRAPCPWTRWVLTIIRAPSNSHSHHLQKTEMWFGVSIPGPCPLLVSALRFFSWITQIGLDTRTRLGRGQQPLEECLTCLIQDQMACSTRAKGQISLLAPWNKLSWRCRGVWNTSVWIMPSSSSSWKLDRHPRQPNNETSTSQGTGKHWDDDLLMVNKLLWCIDTYNQHLCEL